MDNFGIGHAMYGMALTYFQAARATGKTVSMIESLKDGDRVVFTNSQEARRVERLLREAGKPGVECITIPVNQVDRIFDTGPSFGRTIFDHSWVEKFYLRGIRGMQGELQGIENAASRSEEPPRYSDRARMEERKWQV